MCLGAFKPFLILMFIHPRTKISRNQFPSGSCNRNRWRYKNWDNSKYGRKCCKQKSADHCLRSDSDTTRIFICEIKFEVLINLIYFQQKSLKRSRNFEYVSVLSIKSLKKCILIKFVFGGKLFSRKNSESYYYFCLDP